MDKAFGATRAPHEECIEQPLSHIRIHQLGSRGFEGSGKLIEWLFEVIDLSVENIKERMQACKSLGSEQLHGGMKVQMRLTQEQIP